MTSTLFTNLFVQTCQNRILFGHIEAFACENMSETARFMEEQFVHRTTVVTEFKAENAKNTIDQPPYLPDLAPCDFFMLQTLKLPFWRTRFDSIEAIKQNSWKELKTIPENACKKRFGDWKKHWHTEKLFIVKSIIIIFIFIESQWKARI